MTKDNEKPVRQRAIALRYEEEDKAPKIVATGAGEIARRILELAEQSNVPIKKDDSLVDILSKLDVGFEIPPETYRAVAEILAFLYRADEKWLKRIEQKKSLVTPEAQSSIEKVEKEPENRTPRAKDKLES